MSSGGEDYTKKRGGSALNRIGGERTVYTDREGKGLVVLKE